MKIRDLARGVVLAVSAALAGGCYQYVNIPAESGDVAMHTANAEHVVDAEYEALRAVVVDTPISGKYAVVLPAGTFPMTCKQLVSRLGGGASWSEAQSQADLPTLEVRNVYIRGLTASVDVIRPGDLNDLSGPKQLVTVYLKLYAFGGWSADRVRPWHMSVENALRFSRPDAGPATAPATAP